MLLILNLFTGSPLTFLSQNGSHLELKVRERTYLGFISVIFAIAANSPVVNITIQQDEQNFFRIIPEKSCLDLRSF